MVEEGPSRCFTVRLDRVHFASLSKASRCTEARRVVEVPVGARSQEPVRSASPNVAGRNPNLQANLQAMRISVIIATYERPQSLRRCLDSLQNQERLPDAVLPVVRDTDEKTQRLLRESCWEELKVRKVTVTRPGIVAARNAGLAVAEGNIISFTDDDTEPHADWLAQIARHFEERSGVGGVGGRDWLYLNGTLQDASKHPGAGEGVGRVQWHGRIIGNHHLGDGPPREVDVLKGANMSFRREALNGLEFDERLRGSGAQPGDDLQFSLAVKRRGWTLLYDPAVAVDHHLASRLTEGDVRSGLDFNFEHKVGHTHNRTLLMLEHLPWHRRMVYLIWSVLVGTQVSFGLVQLLRFLPREGPRALEKWWASTRGRWQGVKTFLKA